jgi:mutator family transposase
VAAGDIVPVPGAQFGETLASASPDLLREMIRKFAQRMTDAEVEVRCGARYGEGTPERVNSRNRVPAARVGHPGGTIELGIPKLRSDAGWRTGLPDLMQVVAVSRRGGALLAHRLSIPGLRQDHLPALAGSPEPASEANRLPRGPTGPGAALILGDQDEGTERDTGQQVQCGCGYSHAAVADRMAEN